MRSSIDKANFSRTVFFLFLLFTLLAPHSAEACSCGPWFPKGILEQADASMYASVETVERVSIDCRPYGKDEQICRTAYKIFWESLTVLNGLEPENGYLLTRDGAACGARVEEGNDYLFFAVVREGDFWVSGCGSTILKDSPQEEQFWKLLKEELVEESMEILKSLE